ncbi:MAG TPA: hypothetical protein VJ822_11585 [Dongiaceae bacterium]|nr:hypothetical protein [Dongiaceae bacterium]
MQTAIREIAIGPRKARNLREGEFKATAVQGDAPARMKMSAGKSMD